MDARERELPEDRDVRARRGALLFALAACAACATVLGIEAPEPPDASSDGAVDDARRDLGTGERDEGADGGALTDAFEAATVDAPRDDGEVHDAAADAGDAGVCDPTTCASTTCCGDPPECEGPPTGCSSNSYRCRTSKDCSGTNVCCGTLVGTAWHFTCSPPVPGLCQLIACDTSDVCQAPIDCLPADLSNPNCPKLPLSYCGGCAH
jgi:hypothetical protein